MNLPEIQLPSTPRGLRVDVRAVAEPTFAVKATDTGATISIFDAIGLDVTASRIAGALRQIGNRPVLVEMNSPGGNYFEGVAIYNLLRRHPQPITVQILGVAASAASLVAMAGERIEIARNAELMVHNATGMAIGDAATMAETATFLRKVDDALAQTYAARTGLTTAYVADLMSTETFLSAAEAIELGFADAMLSRDADPTPRIVDSRAPATKVDLEATLRRLGYSRSQAARAAAASWPALTRNPDDAVDLEAVAARTETHTEALKAL